MDGWETKPDFSINPWQSLDPFLLATSRRCPVQLPSCHVTSRQFTYRRDGTHKAEQPPRRDWSVTDVMFDELWI